MVQQAAADEVDQTVQVHAGRVVLEEVGMFLDEGDDIKMAFIPGSDSVSGEYVDRLGDTTTGKLTNEVI